MKKLMLNVVTFLMVIGFAQTGSAAVIELWEYGFNIDGIVTADSAPAGVDITNFDDVEGLGTIEATITGQGSHYFGAFFDHDIDEIANTFDNEYGAAIGAPDAGQSWEIDEPWNGDIVPNFNNSGLDNSNGVPAGSENDVSMAMGWDFTLDTDETAVFDLVLSTIAPTTGFYLAHTDPDSPVTIYLSGTFLIEADDPVIIPPGPSAIPEPSTVLLFGLGLLGFTRAGRKNRHH